MKKKKDSLFKAQSGESPAIVPYFLSTLMSNAAITIAGYYEILVLGKGEECAKNLAAYGIVATTYAWLTGIAYFFAMGSGCVVAATKSGGIKKANIGLGLGTAAGLVCMMLGSFMQKEWILFLGAPQDSVQLTFKGIKLLLFTAPALIDVHILATVLRGVGKKISSTVGLSVMGIGQIASVMLLQGFGIGNFDAVIVGVAIGQILSLTTFVIMWIVFLVIHKNGYIIPQKEENGSKNPESFKKIVLQICKSGVPSLARQGSISIGLWASNYVAGIFGVATQSLMTAANRFMTLPFGIVIAVCQAYQPIASNEVEKGQSGKEEYLVARRFGLWMVVITALGIVMTGRGLLLLIPGRLVGEEVLLLVIGSQVVVLPLVVYAQLVVTQFQVCGRWCAGILLATMRNAIIFVPVLCLLSHFLGIWGLLLAQAATDIIVFPISRILLRKRGNFE